VFFLNFELVWGRTISRQVDAKRKYGLNRRVLMDVFDSKLAIMKQTVASWPGYVFHNEDMALQ
jgi:hypothetical protein